MGYPVVEISLTIGYAKILASTSKHHQTVQPLVQVYMLQCYCRQVTRLTLATIRGSAAGSYIQHTGTGILSKEAR